LGAGLEPVHREFETGSGVIDLTFKDEDAVRLAVEVKNVADQETVGQVLKQIYISLYSRSTSRLRDREFAFFHGNDCPNGRTDDPNGQTDDPVGPFDSRSALRV